MNNCNKAARWAGLERSWTLLRMWRMEVSAAVMNTCAAVQKMSPTASN